MDVITYTDLNKSVLKIGGNIIWDVDLGEDENWQPEFHATVLYDGDDKPYRAAITNLWCLKYASGLDYITLLRTLKMFADSPTKTQLELRLSQAHTTSTATVTDNAIRTKPHIADVRAYLSKIRKR